MADGPVSRWSKPLRTFRRADGSTLGHRAPVAPPRNHSVMVVETYFGPITLRPWKPK